MRVWIIAWRRNFGRSKQMCVTTPVYDEDMSDAASRLHFVADNWWIQAV